MDSDNASKEVFQNARIRGSRNNPNSLYLRVLPCGQQFQTKAVIVRVVCFDSARLHKLLSTHELEKRSTKCHTRLSLRGGFVFETFGVFFHGIQQGMVYLRRWK
jgi:hypothetical protein